MPQLEPQQPRVQAPHDTYTREAPVGLSQGLSSSRGPFLQRPAEPPKAVPARGMGDQVRVTPSQASSQAAGEKVSPERATRIQELEEQLRQLRERRTQLLRGLN